MIGLGEECVMWSLDGLRGGLGPGKNLEWLLLDNPGTSRSLELPDILLGSDRTDDGMSWG